MAFIVTIQNWSRTSLHNNPSRVLSRDLEENLLNISANCLQYLNTVQTKVDLYKKACLAKLVKTYNCLWGFSSLWQAFVELATILLQAVLYKSTFVCTVDFKEISQRTSIDNALLYLHWEIFKEKSLKRIFKDIYRQKF